MLSMKLSLISQIALLIYLQVIEWVNLFPWNDIRRGNGQAGLDIAIGAVMIGAIIATLCRLRVVMTIAAALYSVWLWLQIDTWWVGYFAGASPTWKRTYARFFSQTVQILPRDADHLPPDACHLVLQVLIVVALATTVFASISLWRSRHSPSLTCTTATGS